MTDHKDSDPQLHALVDGEISAAERADLRSRMEHDDELRIEACNLSHQKDLVRLAYSDIEQPTCHASRRWPLLAVAASVLLAIGATLFGLQLNNAPIAQSEIATERVVLLDSDGSGQQLADPSRDETRIVFQLTNPDGAKTSEILDEIEDVLQLYANNQKPLRIELVAHGEGLSILRTRLSQHAERIATMDKQFSNLTFVACNNTITRISNEQGFDVEMLPQVVVIQSGVNHVAQRQSEGWAYIHL